MNDTTKLFIGNYDGDLYLFNDVDDHLSAGSTFNLVSTRYSGINVEGYCTVTTSDLDDDGLMNVIIGQDLGGLFAYEEDPNSMANIADIQISGELILYPNPTKGILSMEANLPIRRIQIISLQGEILSDRKMNEHTWTLDLSAYPTGVYLTRTTLENGKIVMNRVVKD
jgi:hypothetical protein